MTLPQSKESRRLFAGFLLIALPVAAVFAYRGTERPWTPACPTYRQYGDPNAPVILVEFSDFQCPACAAAVATMHQIRAQYGEKVHVYYKYLPWLQFHRWAKDAAFTAECAGKQQKFWEMHDLLFSKQIEWAQSEDAPKRFENFARSLKLNLPEFTQCLKDPATAAAIDADIQDAKDHWINSTPTFFVDGQRMVGQKQLQIFGISEIEKRTAS